jgi:hypothetical protein
MVLFFPISINYRLLLFLAYSGPLLWRDIEIFKGLCWTCWDNNVISVIYSVYVLYYIYWFAYNKLSLHSWNGTKLIMVFDLFNVLLNLVWKYFIGNLCIYVHQGSCSIISFIFCCVLIGFWNWGNTGYIEWVW